MKRRKLFALLIAAGLVLLAALLAVRLAQKSKPPAVQTPVAESILELAPTDLVSVQTVDMSMGLPVSGTLRAVNFAVVKARVAGELQGLKLREGDSVKAGQALAQIDPTEYRARLQQTTGQPWQQPTSPAKVWTRPRCWRRYRGRSRSAWPNPVSVWPSMHAFWKLSTSAGWS